MDELVRLADAVLNPLQVLWARVIAFLPNLLAALALIAIGYLVARVLRYLLEGAARRVGIDRFAESVGVAELLTSLSATLTLARLIGALAFWFVLLAFFISAADALQLPRFSSALDDLVRYLPNIAGAMAIVLLGLYFARAIRELVARGAAGLGAEYATALGTTLYLLVVIIAGSLAVSQLNIETALLNQVVVIVIVGAVVATALALGLGGREVAANAIAGIYLRELVKPDDEIEFGATRGRLVGVTAVKTLIATDETTTVSIPNRELLGGLASTRRTSLR